MAPPISFVPPIKLLVVEDHLALLDVTVETLTAQGHEVIGITSAEGLHELPAHFAVDIALLDLNLPGEDGRSLARRLRQLQPGIGITMLTARNALQHKLAGYEHGADIYLTKPIESQELCATVQALAQRLHRSVAPTQQVFIFDPRNRRIKTPQGELLLRPAESVFLHALALMPEQTLAIWEALEALEKPVDDHGKTQLEVLVSRLRGKLIAHGSPATPIRALRGKGYQLCMPLQMI